MKLSFPEFKQTDLFGMTMFGSVNEQAMEKLKSVDLPEKYFKFPGIESDGFEKWFGGDILNTLDLTTYKTEAFGNPFWSSQFAIFIINTDRLTDIINVWNYRALGWNFVALPYKMIKTPFYKHQIEQLQKKFRERSRVSEYIKVIFNREITSTIADECIASLNEIQVNPENKVFYSSQHWLPRFWEQGEFLSYDKAASIDLRSDRKQVLITTDDSKLKVPVLKPPFNKRYVSHAKPRFLNEIFLDYEEMSGYYAQALPEMPTVDLDFIIRGSGFNQWLFSEGQILFLAHENDEYLSLALPQASEVFKKWFAVGNKEIRLSAPGKLGTELLKSIGGIYGTNFLVNRGIPPVLLHFENGRIVLKETLFAEISKQIQLKHFRDRQHATIIAKLIAMNIIEFGAQLQCLFCNQHSFYKLSELNDKVKCPVCHNVYRTPSESPNEIKWAYRGMGPFSRQNKADGLLCVLLTLRFFKISLYPNLITPLFSFEIIENKKVINEVDLAVFSSKSRVNSFEPELFLCECKTGIDFKEDDVLKMKNLAIHNAGAILTFATLKMILSDNEKTRIRKLVNFLRKGLTKRPINPVLILTGNELLPQNSLMPFANIEPRFINHLKFSDEVNHLCDISCQEYLGLESYYTIVEQRWEVRRKARDKKKAGEKKK